MADTIPPPPSAENTASATPARRRVVLAAPVVPESTPPAPAPPAPEPAPSVPVITVETPRNELSRRGPLARLWAARGGWLGPIASRNARGPGFVSTSRAGGKC